MSVRKRCWTTRLGEQKERWVVDYVSQTGTRHLKTFAKKKDADAYHSRVCVDVADGVHTPHSRSITVEEAAADWIAHVEAEGRERTTVNAYRQHVAIHIAPKIGHVKLAQLSTPLLHRFRDDLLASVSVATGEKMSRVMARKVLGSLKSLLKDAQRRGNVAQNVATGVSVSLNMRDRKKLRVGVDVPTVDEVRRMIATAQGRARVMLVTVCFTGLRSSEMRGLRWPDVELDGAEPKLHVRQRADRWGKIGPLKSASSERTIPLGPYIANTLRAWRDLKSDASDLVLATANGTVQFHQTLVQRMSHKVQINAGIVDEHGRPKYLGLHCLRHFFASWCINRRVDGGLELPLKTVQSRLGHSTLAMTADVYGHLFPSSDDHSELLAAERALGLHVA